MSFWAAFAGLIAAGLGGRKFLLRFCRIRGSSPKRNERSWSRILCEVQNSSEFHEISETQWSQ